MKDHLVKAASEIIHNHNILVTWCLDASDNSVLDTVAG